MRKKWKAIGTLALSVMLGTLSITGCAGGSEENGEASSDTAEAIAGDEVSEYFHSKDPYTIKLMIFGSGSTAAIQDIQEHLNQITEEKLNADVEITMVNYGSITEQLNMALASGEELDLFSPLSTSVTEYITNGQIQPINEVLDRFGSGIKETYGEENWDSLTYENENYYVPVNAKGAQAMGFVMRKDICDELGVDASSITDIDKLHQLLTQVKETHPELYPVVSDGGAMQSALSWIGQDEAGDMLHLTVAEDPYAENPEIVSFFDTDLFRERCETMYQWAKEGLIMPDASTNTEAAMTLIQAGKGFGTFMHCSPGTPAQATSQTGRECVVAQYGEKMMFADGMKWCIPTNSGDPERAMAFLNLMYTDAEVANLLINGVEGTDYVMTDTENVVDYPEGMDSSSARFLRQAWAWPNEQIAYFWEGEDTEIYAKNDAFAEDAKVPTSYGFAFDTTYVMNEVTACTNVYNKYVEALYSGSLDPETTIPKLQEEMEKAGIDAIAEEKQKQLDEWLAEKRN